MNRFLATIFLFLALCFASSGQISFSNSATYQSISGTVTSTATNVGGWVLIGNAKILPPVYSLSHSALLSLQDVTNYIQISVGGTGSPQTIAVVSPARTNANDVDAFTLTTQNLPVYTRVLVAATNAISAGAQVTLGVNAVQ